MAGVSGSGAMAGEATPFWARPAGYALIALLLSAPRLIVGLKLGLLSDEAYYALVDVSGAGLFRPRAARLDL